MLQGPNSVAVRTRQVVITNDYWQKKQAGRGQLGILVGPDNGLRPQSSLVVPMASGVSFSLLLIPAHLLVFFACALSLHVALLVSEIG